MNYNDLKKEHDSLKIAVIKKKHELDDLRKEREKLNVSQSDLNSKYTEQYTKAKQQSASEYKKKLLAPVEKELLEEEKNLEGLRVTYSSEMEQITYDSVAEECSSEQEILNEVESAVDKLRKLIERTIGKQFCEEILKQMQSASSKISKEELPQLIDYFNQRSEEVEQMLQNNKIDAIVMKAEFMLSTDVDASFSSNKKALTALSVVFIVLSLFAAKYVFPFYVVFLCLIAAYNVVRSGKFQEMLALSRLVSDNVKQIAEMLCKEIESEVERRQKKVRDFYEFEIKSSEEKIEFLRTKVMNVSVTAERTFAFDDSAIKQNFSSEMEHSSKLTMELATKERSIIDELSDLETKEAALRNKLNHLVGDIQNKFLNFDKVGEATVLDPNFLFDIDMDKNKPVFFKHPQSSCLFLYEDINEAVSFVRLLIVQLRCKLSPFCQAVSVLDEDHLGQDFLYFRTSGVSEDSPEAGLFSIYTEKEGLQHKIDDLSLELMQRTESMRREFHNIEEYNNAMIAMDSVTASYEFMFMLSPSLQLLEDSNIRKLLINGGTYGIFLHVFLCTDDFKAEKDSSKKLLDCVDKIYLLMNGNFNIRAKSYIVENYLPDTRSS